MFEIVSNKAWLRKANLLVLPAVVILVGIGAFGLGRLSAIEQQKPALRVYAPGQTLAQPAVAPTLPKSATDPTQKNFVASKNGTKYYPAGCSSASRIKAANEVWFATAAEAASAGYSLASGC